MKKLYVFATIFVLAGCTTYVHENFTALFGTDNPARFDTPRLPHGSISYRDDVKPILDKRCVVCHACYDAPCQLKLGSWEGIARGASATPVYDPTRLTEAEPTRLFVDAHKASEWRARGFFPVLNEYPKNPEAEQRASLLARAIELKEQHPVTPNTPAPKELGFSTNRVQQCSPVESYQDYERRNPDWGMPFGLPGLSVQETDTIKTWLRQGAPYEGPEQPTANALRQIVQWEQFLNGDSLREQLVSRYIYEHLFFAHLYFENESPARYFQLVRSSTPPGEPVQEIATRRPFDDPGIKRVYYRFRPVDETIVAKTHMPYALSAARMAHWTELFYDQKYSVEELPAYKPEQASNPFETFRDLPVSSRYRFMLDEAQFTVMGFIKGPVCRGQTALNVIDDHFWVFFQDPDSMSEDDAVFLKRESRNLSLPAGDQDKSLMLTPWFRYSRQETKFLEAKSAYYEQRFDTPGKVNVNLIWEGDGENPNAALTIYRHFDSATVLKGLVGQPPKTAWVMNYSLLERIHYLLVAGYDVYGNIGHQLNTRLYMDFLRMEGEFNFIAMLPQASRLAVRDYWYRGTSNEIKDHVYGKYAHFDRETGIHFENADHPDTALMSMLKARLSRVDSKRYDIGKTDDAELRKELLELAAVHGPALSWLPESSILRIEEPGKPSLHFSLLRNTARSNVANFIYETITLLPEEHTLDVLNGFATAYPNAFYRVERNNLPAFIDQVRHLSSEQEYGEFVKRFGIRRTSAQFWALSDDINADYARTMPIEAGLLDYNRLENR
jgi:hypothetical protein